jgi:glycosyltransferase involved in cell wall biosynthesis
MLLDVVLGLRQSECGCAGLRLVLVGSDRGLLESLTRQAKHDADALVHIAAASDDELIDWYRRAAVFAYPSRYEGFGLPPLEAMACGTPVLASSAGSIPEVVGTAALLLSVDDVRGWREAMRAVLTNAAFAAELGGRGPGRASQFTWERTALDTVACYERAAARRSPFLRGPRVEGHPD